MENIILHCPSLAVTTIPHVPETITELAESRMLIGTREHHPDFPNPATFSTFTKSVLAEMITMSGHCSRHGMYSYLESSVLFFTDNFITMVKKVSWNRTIKVNSSRLVNIPHTFAIIDPSRLVKRVKRLFQELDVFWVSKPVDA